MDNPITFVSLGDIAWDVFYQPSPDGKEPNILLSCPGGSAANFAVWSARHRIETRLVGKAGANDYGMADHLRKEDVKIHLRFVEDVLTAQLDILLDGNVSKPFRMRKDRRLGFSQKDVSPDIFDISAILESADLLFFTGYAISSQDSLRFIEIVLEETRKRKIPIAFDPGACHFLRGLGSPTLMEKLGMLDFLLLNEEEAENMFQGKNPECLLKLAKVVVLKQGDRGASVYTTERTLSCPGIPCTVVDTTGAGDAFNAAFLATYFISGNLDLSLSRANRLGAYVVRHVGSQPVQNYCLRPEQLGVVNG